MWGRKSFSAWISALVILLAGPVAHSQAPEQVVVSVKIIEFQVTKGVETGLSAFFTKVSRAEPFGVVDAPGAGVGTVDLTFPTSTAAGITVFLDRISLGQGELEIVLQALVDENRAFILSRPHAMVKVGEPTPTIVETSQRIPFESTRVVGSTTVQVTEFEDTGVRLELKVPEIIDDDGDWNTSDDTYIRLDVQASVKEEGQRIVVALDDQLANSSSDFSAAASAITVPEFISRSITTHVWVPHGSALLMGGLFRNSETKNISTVPLLSQAQDAAVGFVENVVSGNFAASPFTSTIGSRDADESRRELVFLIKAETWRPSFTISDELGFAGPTPNHKRRGPTDVITSVGQGVANLLTGREKKDSGAEEKTP